MTFIRTLLFMGLLVFCEQLPAQTLTYTDTEIRSEWVDDLKIFVTKEGDCHLWKSGFDGVYMYRYDQYLHFKDRLRVAFESPAVSFSETKDGYVVMVSGDRKTLVYQWQNGALKQLENTAINKLISASKAAYIHILAVDTTIFLVQLNAPAKDNIGKIQVDFFDLAINPIKSVEAAISDMDYVNPSFSFLPTSNSLLFSYMINPAMANGFRVLGFQAHKDQPATQLFRSPDLVFSDHKLLKLGDEILMHTNASDPAIEGGDIFNYIIRINKDLDVKSAEFITKAKNAPFWKARYRYIPHRLFSLPNKQYMVTDNVFPEWMPNMTYENGFIRFLALDSSLQPIKAWHFSLLRTDIRPLFVTELNGKVKWLAASNKIGKDIEYNLFSYSIEDDMIKPDAAFRLQPHTRYLPENAVQTAPGILVVPYLRDAKKWGLVKINWNTN
ncbi:MAG TPA: hypothetical protein PKJ36_05240 [Flavihumibacter sp.]|nr:hypothetical protein [Flavihumibacter sp.]